MDAADAQEGHPTDDEVDCGTHSADKKLLSEDEVDGGVLHSVGKKIPSEKAVEGQTFAGTEATDMDEKCAQDVVFVPNEENGVPVPKTNDQPDVSQSTAEIITVIDAKKITYSEGEADNERNKCASDVEETRCGSSNDEKSKNKSSDRSTNSPATDDVHKTSTDDPSSDHQIIVKSKKAVLEIAPCEKTVGGSLSSSAEQPKHDQNLLKESKHSVCGRILQASTHHEGCYSSGELVIDKLANKQQTDNVHEGSLGETSFDHGALTRQSQNVLENATDIHQTSVDESSSGHGALTKEKQIDLDKAACEPKGDSSLSLLAEQPSCDQNLLEETPVSTCGDHTDQVLEHTGLSLQACTHHEEGDSSGELIVNKVRCETKDEGELSNVSVDTNNPPKDMVCQSSTGEAFSDHMVQNQSVQWGSSKEGSSVSPAVEHPAHGQDLEETALSGGEDQSSAKTATECGELVTHKDECETEHENGVFGACQKLNENESQCQDSSDSMSQSTQIEGKELAIGLNKSLLTREQGDANGHENSSELAEAVTSNTQESLIDETIQETLKVARPEQCGEIGCDVTVVPNHGDDISDSGARDATAQQDCEAPDAPEGKAADPPEGDVVNPLLICPQDVEASDPPEGDASDPSESDAVGPNSGGAALPGGDVFDPPEGDISDPPGDAFDPLKSESADPKQGDVADTPEGNATDPPEGDTSDPPEGDAYDPIEDDADPKEGYGTDGVICSPNRKDLQHTCESQPFDVDHIQSSTEDTSQEKKVEEQHEEHTCSSQNEVHDSKQTCESQPFDVDHIQSSVEDPSQDISTEHLLRGCPISEGEKMTDNVSKDTVMEGNLDQGAAKETFTEKDTTNSSHGFVMLSPFTLSREEFDAQGNSIDLNKSSEQASVVSVERICDAVQNTVEGRVDTSVAKGEHPKSSSSDIAERPCNSTAYFEAGDTENETAVGGTEDEEAGEEVDTGGDERKPAKDSEDRPPQQELKIKSPEKGRISIGYSKRKDKFKCFLCDEIGSGSSFEEHVMQHLLWKPYKCLYCSQYFITRSDIGSHVSECHDGKQLRCGLRAIKKAKDCMLEAQRKGTCVYFADKLNGMYWSCKKKKMEEEATLENEKAGDMSTTSDMSLQRSEEPGQGSKQVSEPSDDLHQTVESNQSDINQRISESALEQRNVIQPRSDDFHKIHNSSHSANQGKEIRNSTPEAVHAQQSVGPGADGTISATSLGTVSATATSATTATGASSMPTVCPVATPTITAQAQAKTEGEVPVQVQPKSGPVSNVFPSDMPGTISPRHRNLQVVHTTDITIPPVPMFLTAVSGAPVLPDPSNTPLSSLLTSPPTNTVVGQLTLSPTKMPQAHCISSEPNQIIIGNPASVPVNQQPNMQPILIPVSLNTNVNMNVNPIGVTSGAVCPTVSSKGENSKREIHPAQSKGSPDKKPKPKDKQLKFHDTTKTFMSPSASANIAILPRPPVPVQNSAVLTSFLVPSQQTLLGTPQVLSPTAAPGFIQQNVSFVNPNCQLLVLQKAGYGNLKELPSLNQKAPPETETFHSPDDPKPPEVQQTVTTKNIRATEVQKHTLATERFLQKPQSLEPSKRVCVMFTIGLVNGTYACAMCRGRFKHEDSFRAHLWSHIHDVDVPCPDCRMCIMPGLKTLTCAKTEGYIEKLKNSLVGKSSYLEIKGYRTVSNPADVHHPNEPNMAQKNQVDKSKVSPAIIDISSEVLRDPGQKPIILKTRLKPSAPAVHGNKVIAKTGVEEHSVTFTSGDPSNAGTASGTEVPSLKVLHPNNSDDLEKSKATPGQTSVKATSRTVSLMDAHITEEHLPSRTRNQDIDQRSEDVAKPVSSVEGGHTSSDAKDSQSLPKRSESDLNSNTPSPVKAATTWTFYVCGAQCGYSSLYPQEFKKHVGECNQPGSLLCFHCQYSSDGPESLLRHLVKHYVGHAPGVAVHTCLVSGCRFTTNILQGYYQHLATSHMDVKEYECNYCKDVFSDLVSFMKHLQENILHIVSCRYCNAKDCVKTVLVRHIVESHPGKSRMTNMLKHLVCKDRKDNRLHALSVSSAKSASAPPADASTSASVDTSAVLEDDRPVDQNIVLEIDRAGSPKSLENIDTTHSCNDPGDESSLGCSLDTSLDPVLGCQLCTYVGLNIHDLNTHIAKHDDKTDKMASSFQCSECPEGFSSLSNFEIHLRKHSKLLTYNLYVCSVCKFLMGSNDGMLNHMADVHKLTGKAQLQFSRTLKVSKTDILTCSSCPFQCLGQDIFDKHRQRCHLSGANNTSNQMSSASTNEDPSPASIKSAGDDQKHVCNTSTEKVQTKLKMTIPNNSVFISPVRCISCNYTTVYKTNILRHINKDHPEIEIEVEAGKIGSPVEKVMTDAGPKEEEQNDTRLQLGSPLLDTELEWLYECHGSSYCCMMCSKTLYKKNYLHGHILDHLDISLWKCKECDFKSSRRSAVKDHMNEVHDKKCHTEEIIPVVDEVRPKIFKVLGKLIQDDQLVTDVKPSLGTKELDEKLKNKYKVIGKQKICRCCETEHQSLYSMHSHILRRHFGLHLFKCCYCDFSGLERYSVAKHCKEKHPEKELTVRYLHNNIKDLLSNKGKKRYERSHLSATTSSSSDHSPSNNRPTELRVGSDMLDQKLQPLYDVRMGKTRKLICKSCHADYPSKYSLHCHLLRHLKLNLVACPHCNFELLEQSKMGAHIKVVHPGSQVYFKFLDVDIESAVKEYLDKKENRHKTERKKSSKAVKPKLSDILGRRKATSPIKPVRSPGKISKNVIAVTAGGLKRFKCRLCDYMALTKNSVGTHVFKVHNSSGTKTTSVTTNFSNSLVPDYFICKFCKFKTHQLELLKSHYKHKHPKETLESAGAQENNIESGDEGGEDDYDNDDDDDDDFTPDSCQKWTFQHPEKEKCRSEDGNPNSGSACSEPAKEHDQHERELSLRIFEDARVVLEKVDCGDRVVSDISERVKLKKRKELYHEENSEVQPAKKQKTLESEPRRMSYKCPKCSYVDSNKNRGVLHLKVKHNLSKLMECAHCGVSFFTEDKMKSHFRFFHKGKEILYQDKPLETLLQEVTGSQPSEVTPTADDSQSSEKASNAAQKKSTLPEGSSESDHAPNPAKSLKPQKDKVSSKLKDSNKIQRDTEASNNSSKDSSRNVSKDPKTSTNVSHSEESMYAAFVPSSPDTSDNEERVYYKYVCVYCDGYRNRKSEIKTHLAKHCLERLHGNKIPEAEDARLKIKKKVRDIIPICVERASNKKIKISSEIETIKPDASSAVSETETIKPDASSAVSETETPAVQQKHVTYENKASKSKGNVESESDSDSINVVKPAKKKRRRIKPVISSSDEDEPSTACKEKKVKTTAQSSRIYCCHLCRYKVASLYKFRSHLAAHGNFKHLNPDMSMGLMLKCGFCGYQAKDKESFSQHVEKHLDGRIYKCGYCKYDSYHSKNVRSHLKNKHRHKRENMIDLRISMNERALRPSGKPELVNLDPTVMLADVFMSKDFARLLKEQGVRTVDMDEAMKDVILGEPGQMIEVMDMEIADFSDEEDSDSDDEYKVDDDAIDETSSSEGSHVPLGDLEFDDVSDDDLYKMAPSPTD
ncbi:uncharacterized protein [Haliotis asinina]|uniref:uncharacterized protein n=1 Tax=Haliotis asinina TaxID=109174 RepID=UPI003531A8C1